MDDTPDEPPIGDVFGQPARPRWLAATVVLLIGLAVGAVIALRYGDDTDDATIASVSEQTTVVETSSPPSTSEVAATTEPTQPETTEQPETSTSEDDDETTTDPSTTVETAPPSTYGEIAPGQGVATLKIPKLNLTAFVLAGTSPAEMATAVGHLSTTSAPGQIGNAVMVGYRTTEPKLFENLDQLAVGDVIEVDTVLGGVYFYQVDGAVVVEPINDSIVSASVPGKATLTLITCTPKGSTLQRLVVHAALVEKLSSPAGPAQVNYGQDEAVVPSIEPCNMTPPTSGT